MLGGGLWSPQGQGWRHPRANDDLQELFTPHGAVASAKVIIDHETGRVHGFGFVERTRAHDAQRAIQDLDGQDFKGRNLKVNVATRASPYTT